MIGLQDLFFIPVALLIVINVGRRRFSSHIIFFILSSNTLSMVNMLMCY